MEYLLNSNEIAIYIHIPFCKQRCLYCDYVSTTNTKLKDIYFEALKKELTLRSNELKDKKVKTVYLGGGTPSYVELYYIEDIFHILKDNYNLSELEEFTIEVNPESINEFKLRTYKSMGINRISVGFQSTSDNILKNVGRLHTFEEGVKAYNLISSFFENVNIDFILGLPGENKNTVEKTLEYIGKLKPPHISYYLFDPSHETPLKNLCENGKMHLPDSDLLSDLLDFIYQKLEKIGYNRYEISSWSQDNKESLHNEFYWKNLNYIGFGLSAGGHLNRFRYVNTCDIEVYVQALTSDNFAYEFTYNNNEYQELTETLFMGLRLLEGVNYESLLDRFEKTISDEFINKILKNLQGYITYEDGVIKLTKKGLDFSRYVFEELIS